MAHGHTMAANYAGGHCWDHLDGEACTKAADEIAQLRSALESLVSAVGNMKVPQTALDAALMLHVTLGPTYERAKQAIAR